MNINPEGLGRHHRAAALPLRGRFAQELRGGCRGWRGEGRGQRRPRSGAERGAVRGAERSAERSGAALGTAAAAHGAPAPTLAGEGQRLIGLGRLP